MVNQYNKTITTYLIWMLEMIDKIERYTVDIKTYEEFIASEIVTDAVITPLTQLGEKSNQIKKLEYTRFDKQLPLKEMNEIRNFLVHTYHKIDYYFIRDVIQNHIPQLKDQILDILNKENIVQ